MKTQIYLTRCCLVALLIVALAPVAALASNVPVHDVSRASSPIQIDGVLDEPAWSTATSIELAWEVQPGDNVEPPVRTICYISYDESHMYFGFHCQDPDPSQIRARYSDRDKAWSDDWVGIVLDTFNDQRRAYELFSTPLGVQIDALNNDVSQIYDDSWNAIWASAGRITDEGYEVEMAVPFNQIRFQKTDGEQIWGFDANRSYPRDFRHHMGAFPRDRGNNSYLGQAIKIKGMAGASPGRNIELIPTVTASRVDQREELSSEDFSNGDTDVDFGASLRWGITPNMSLNGAYNPDFSQVEADALQLSENEQFALFYAETRPFFLEGADYFNTDLNLVYTRTVVDPDGALKLTGKQGRHTWGTFSAVDKVTNLIIPGLEGSDSGQFDAENLSSAARYRMDVGSNSFVGLTGTDRRGEGYANSVVSADAVYRMTDRDQFNAGAAYSFTNYSEDMIAELDAATGTIDDLALNASYNHGERGWWVYAEGNQRGNDYRADLGFDPAVGFRDMYVGGAKVWWGEPGDALQRSAWGGAYSRSDALDGGEQRERYETWFNANLPLQTEWHSNAWIGQQHFDDTLYDVWDVNFGIHSQVTGDLNLTFHGQYGDWIDFANAQGATRLVATPEANYTFGRHLNLTLRHIYSQLNVDDGRLFIINAPQLRAVHQFNARAFVRLVLQYTDTDRDASLYIDEVDSRSQYLLTQFLFTYKVNPQTALYAGYGDNQFADDDYDLTRTDRTFFMKVGYAWVK